MARTFVCTADHPVVETRAGKLRGFILDGTYTFYGIKYADAKRFQPPQPVQSWEGIKDATNYGCICPVLSHPIPASELFIPHRFWPADENCQYLNIWTRSLSKKEKRPVMVWLHGGGFSDGSSMEQVAYEGDKLAEYGDVVVVTINHRLNILGFLDMSSYSEKYANSVNAGMADIVAALEWVHENIEAFGGDPRNVTVFGQSGGGGKVEALMQIPAAAGLFHKAIMMSGVLSMPNSDELDHRTLIDGILKELDIPPEYVERLENVPYELLSRAYKKVCAEQDIASSWFPAANDWFLGDPMKVGFSDYAKKVPTMVGTVVAEFADRTRLDVENAMSGEEKISAVREKYGDAADQLMEHFKKTYPDKDILLLNKLDNVFRPVTVDFAAKKVQESAAPTYLYEFALNFDIKGGAPAWHCSDIPFVFYNTDRVFNCNIEGVTERLQDQMAGAWVSFAYSGNPNHPGLPKWEPYSNGHVTMVFDRECQGREDLDTELLRLLPVMTIKDMMANMAKRTQSQTAQRDWMY